MLRPKEEIKRKRGQHGTDNIFGERCDMNMKDEYGYATTERGKAEKRRQFVKLCSSLTKQGFNFVKAKGCHCALKFDRVSAARLHDPDTKKPYVNALIRIASDSKYVGYQFDQWAGR